MAEGKIIKYFHVFSSSYDKPNIFFFFNLVSEFGPQEESKGKIYMSELHYPNQRIFLFYAL